MHEHLRYETADRIATIILNRPDRMNAFTWEMVDAWAAALAEAQRDDAVSVIIVTGAGKAFCSGGDIQGMGERRERTPLQRKNELAAHVHRIPLTLESVDKPVIAAINGAAAGAGLDLALQCDLRYAAESARLGETYVRVGLVPGAGGTWFLPRLVGAAKALELFWTGELISAEEAERIGMVNKVLPDDRLMDHVREVAGKIARAPQLSVRFIKRAVYQGARIDLRTSLDLISSHYAVVSSSADHKEAVQAYLEKRKPNFTGS
ncbi:MAG TPA: enoyl-CoA hydratase-related protein [Stellaceae bacterium]|nr:enoyl-CoA hydratase-related protein [Stellaceae bacterium]